MASKRSSVRLTSIPSNLPSTATSSAHQVLIIEDEILLAREVEAHLMELGYSIAGIALSAPEAIAILKTQPVDIVLMDIILSGEMDGITTAIYVRQEFHLPIIYLTAYSDVHLLSQAAFTCPSGYLMKPCTTTDLYITLEIALAQHQLEGELRQALMEAERLKTVDALTGVLTAHRLFTMAEKEFHRARRYQHPFSLVMLSITPRVKLDEMDDHLYPHQDDQEIGDRLPVTVAHTAQSCLRQADYLGHLEKEGFGVILPETDAQSAMAVAKRIRDVLAQLSPQSLELGDSAIKIENPNAPNSPAPHFPAINDFGVAHVQEDYPQGDHIRENYGIVVSMGVADWNPTDPDVMTIFRRAERALTQAKRQGCNSIVLQS